MYTLSMKRAFFRGGDWLEAGLLFLLLQVASARLVTTGWAPYLYFAESITALGTILGLALGISRHTRRIVIWFVIDYTVVLLPWQMTGAIEARMNFWDKITTVTGRLWLALGQFVLRQPVKDSFFFVACVSLGFWLVSLAAGYWLMRHHNLLVAILPAGLATLIVQIYDNQVPGRSWWLAVYITLALLLIGRAYYLNSRAEWIKRRLVVNEEAWTDILNGLLATVVLSVLLAWTVPTSLSSLHSAAEAWTDLTKPLLDRLSNATTSLKSTSPSVQGVSFYSETLPLGQEAATGDSTTLTVQVISQPDFTSRYYWRGRVYDFYNNGQWSATPAARLDFLPAGGNLSLPDPQNRELAVFQFQTQLPQQSLLYLPSQPVWVDQPGTIQSTVVEKTTYDILSWQAVPPIPSDEVYQVQAEISNPTVEDLRSAGTDYPDWVTNRYLEVPARLKADLQTLTANVTTGQSTPYDQALAITSYLRSTIQYSTSVPAPPTGQDPVLWVLLDYQKGFCNYYASAEVLMLRSIGIPARLAVGFAQGEFDSGTRSYTVRNRDAHAWPEVYFPNIGWIEFEPTASQFPLNRPGAVLPAPGGETTPPRRPNPLDEGANPQGQNGRNVPFTPISFMQTNSGRLTAYGLAALVILLLVFLLYRYRLFIRLPVYLSKMLEHGGTPTPAWIENWVRWNQLTPVEKAFSSVNLSLGWLGKPQPIYATPAERASELTRLLPSAAASIQTLSAELETALFTRRRANLTNARRAGLRILFTALRVRLQQKLDSINGNYYEMR